MMLIGTSLGGCLKSILMGEVSEDNVALIVARTKTTDLEDFLDLVKSYYFDGNPYAPLSEKYQFKETDSLEQLQAIAYRLYIGGRIHQPRLFEHGRELLVYLQHDALWLEVNPVSLNKNPAVIDAYEKYKMLDNLTK